MTTEPLSPSAAPVEAPIKSEKKGIQLEWVRRASVVVGVALLFIIFSGVVPKEGLSRLGHSFTSNIFLKRFLFCSCSVRFFSRWAKG
jgi:hypothetical protein